MRLVLKGGKAYVGGKLSRKDILVDGGRIARISPNIPDTGREMDCRGKIILPGAIDCHVHFRTPGLEYKENLVSGSLAALHGGITTVMDMPNTEPATTTLRRWEEKKALAKRECAVNFDAYVGATGDNLGEIEAASEKGLRAVKVYFGRSTGGMLFNDEASLKQLFVLAKEKGFVVSVHAEDDAEVERNAKAFPGDAEPGVHAKIRNSSAEAKAIGKVVSLNSGIGCRLHIAHVSSAKGIDIIAREKLSGMMITCEATPHHLFLDSGSYRKLGNLVKCNPSIKEPSDRKALWRGLKSGTIDVVATDHAPHTFEEKSRPYRECPAGVPGVETMIPLLLDAVSRGSISLSRVVGACCEKPAEIFGWKSKGFVREGFDADLIVVDTKKSWLVENEKLFTKACYSPFNGRRLKGFVDKTIVGGEIFG